MLIESSPNLLRAFEIVTGLLLLFSVVAFILFLCIKRKRRRNEIKASLADKFLFYSSPGFVTTNRSVFPLIQLSTLEFSIPRSISSRNDGSMSTTDTSCPENQSKPTATTTKTPIDDENKRQTKYCRSNQFLIELTCRIAYFPENKEVRFVLKRLKPMNILLEEYFNMFSCHIRLMNEEELNSIVEFDSHRNPVNEEFTFKLEEFLLRRSFIKLFVIGHRHGSRATQLGQTLLLLNKISTKVFETSKEEQLKFIQVYEDQVDLIIENQVRLSSWLPDKTTKSKVELVYR